MQLQRQSSILFSRLVLTLGLSTAANFLSASVTQAQASLNSLSSTPPLPSIPLASEITRPARVAPYPNHFTPNAKRQTKLLLDEFPSHSTTDRLHRPQIEERLDVQFSTQAKDLLPSYEDLSPTYGKVRLGEFSLAQETLAQETLAQETLAQETDADTAPAPGNPDETGNTPSSTDADRGALKIPLGQGDFFYGLGSLLGEPTALEGPTRRLPVPAQSTRISVVSLVGYLGQRLNENQFLLMEFFADPKLLGVDLGYTNSPSSLPGAFTVNFFNQRGRNPAFENGETEVDLANGNDPWVHRIGGGVEYETPLTDNLSIAAALNYQRISVRDDAFSNNRESVDELGNRVTVSDDGRDDLLTLSLVGFLEDLEGEGFAYEGTRIQFGVDQSIPVGDANILMSRLVGNVTQFIPLRIFTGEPGSVVLNLQSGVTIGDVPPYESLNLGGSESVRGFETGGVGSARSFIQASAEYRFPLFSFSVFKLPIGMGGVLFVDYANDLGTADSITGAPAEARDKPGDGLGYGLGLHGLTPIGLLRLELGFNDNGDSEFHLVFGDRF